MKKILLGSFLVLMGCKGEVTEVTTTPAVSNPYPTSGISLLPDQKLTNPRFRFHDGTVYNYAPHILDEVPNLPNYPVSSWYVTQWKKPSLLTPDRMVLNSGKVDSKFGPSVIQYYSDSYNDKNLSEINIFKAEDSSYVYELASRGGWLDTGGGSNLFLSTPFLNNNVESLEKRIDLNFKAKIKERITQYIASNSSKDGSVVSQFFTGFTYNYYNPDLKEITPIFVQIYHADSREEKYLAPGKLEYRGCYKGELGNKQIVFGSNLPNALGGNGFLAAPQADGDLNAFSFNLNDQICNMIKKSFNCQDGTTFSFPENAKDLKNWSVGSIYIGLETQEALAADFNIIPTVAGPDKGKSSLTVQLKDLELMKYPSIPRLNCDDSSNSTNTGTVLKYCTDPKQVLQNNSCQEMSADISGGRFCNGESLIAFQCGGTKPMSDWVDVGSGCFHYNTGTKCSK